MFQNRNGGRIQSRIGPPSKRNPTVMPCENNSCELLEFKWSRIEGRRLPVKACRWPSKLRLHVRLTYGSRIAFLKHEHGRVKTVKFLTVKSFQRTCNRANEPFTVSLRRETSIDSP